MRDFLWDLIRSRIYAAQPPSLGELCDRIVLEHAQMALEILRNVRFNSTKSLSFHDGQWRTFSSLFKR